MGDYPDHLNPFKKSGIRESFRTIKSAIGGRFRKKKGHHSPAPATRESYSDATLRHHPNHATTNGGGGGGGSEAVMTRHSETMVFPRSRFNDRVARSHTMGFQPQNEDATNPFGETTVLPPHPQQNGGGAIGVGVDTMQRRRRKKRAPLPPGFNNNLNVDHHTGSSQWSISSYETDYSTTTSAHGGQSEGELEAQDVERLRDIEEISKEIQNYSFVMNDENGDVKPKNDEEPPQLVGVIPNEEVIQVQEADTTINHASNDDKIESLESSEATDIITTVEQVKKEVEVVEKVEIKDADHEDLDGIKVKKDAKVAKVEINHADNDNDNFGGIEVKKVVEVIEKVETKDADEEDLGGIEGEDEYSHVKDVVAHFEMKINAEESEINNKNNNNLEIATIETCKDGVAPFASQEEEEETSIDDCDISKDSNNLDDVPEPEIVNGEKPTPKMRKHKLCKSAMLGAEVPEVTVVPAPEVQHASVTNGDSTDGTEKVVGNGEQSIVTHS